MKKLIKNNWVLIVILIIVLLTMIFMNREVEQNNDKMSNIKNNELERWNS